MNGGIIEKGELLATTGLISREDYMTGLTVLDNYPQAATGIEKLEAHMLALPQVECPVYHRFGVGVYIREIHIPAGAICVGHHQKYAQNNLFLKGKVLMMQDDGIVELEAPMFYVGTPGRKIGLAVEDIVWQNIYVTDETDIEKLESMFLDKSDFADGRLSADFLEMVEKREPDRIDYAGMLSGLSISEEDVRLFFESLPDSGIKYGQFVCAVYSSPIAGRGLFATASVKKGDVIGGSVMARMLNHSRNPNAELHITADGVAIVALENIQGNMGGIVGNEITIDYRKLFAEVKK